MSHVVFSLFWISELLLFIKMKGFSVVVAEVGVSGFDSGVWFAAKEKAFIPKLDDGGIGGGPRSGDDGGGGGGWSGGGGGFLF